MSIVDLSDSGYMTQIINLYIGLFGELIQSLCFSYFYRSKALTIKDMIKIQIQNCTNHWSEKVQFSSVQSLIRVRLFATPWAAACQASLSFTNSWSLLKLTCIELVMPCNHLILCCPLLLLPPIPPSIRVFSSESFASGDQSIGVSASASILPMNKQDWSSLGWTGWISLQSKGLSRVFSNTTVQKHQFFGTQLSSQSNPHTHTWPLEKTIALTRWTFVDKVMSLLFNMQSRLVITFLPRSKHL